MPYIVESLLNVKEDGGTLFPSMVSFIFIDDSVALLDCGVIGSEAKLVCWDVINRYCFF
jgi:hypothetical protein